MQRKKIRYVIISSIFLLAALTACTDTSATSTTDTLTTTTSSVVEDSSTEEGTDASFFTSEIVHSISIDVDENELASLIESYQTDGTKEWIEASVTIDGTSFESVGLKLKGNSTLRTISNQSSEEINVEELPWVIRLDKYVDDQEYMGRSRFVIRGNNTESSLNEAVALAMLNEAGVQTEESIFSSFSINGSEAKLRLVIDVPDDDLWTEEHFGTEGVLYKAESGGDYSYRGTEVSDYEGVFEQKYGQDDFTPLITFLEFINNATDEEFAEQLEDYLDVDAFATYLAMQDLVGNEDDIDGPGNNSYLYYDYETSKMTVVAWDQNLSLGSGMMGNRPEGEFDPEDFSGTERPEFPENGNFEGGEGFEPPADFENGEMPTEPLEGGRPNGEGMKGMGENTLATRFIENSSFSELIEEKKSEYTASFIDSHFASDLLEQYQTLLAEQASDFIDSETLNSEVSTISEYLTNTLSEPKAETQETTSEVQ